MAIAELCTREVVVADRHESVQALAELMRGYHSGDVVIAEQRAQGRVPVGMVTDRDLVVEVMAPRIDARELTAADVMSADLVTATEDADLLDATAIMRRQGVRRLVVTDAAGYLVGILSLDDILEAAAEQLENLRSLLYREREREEQTRSAP